jgi:hypothetical protein
MAEPLQVDIDALGRLLPQLNSLSAELSKGAPASIPAGGTVDAAAVPSLAAAQEMSARTLPVAQAAVAARFGKIGELIEKARAGFVKSDGELQQAINTVPTLQPPAAGG